MPFIDTPIADLKIFEPKIWADERGYFYESYNKNIFEAAGINSDFVQDNQARSTYGVLRGLHYQVGKYAQAKLVRVILGKVLDVVVDIRPGSETYGKWYSIELSAENHRQLYVPSGFAHGYVCLSETAIFAYKCDNFYDKESEGGIIYNDATLNIDWQIDLKDAIVSDKDTVLPTLGKHKEYFK
jgi:dTDP-4-dehydrorhamnose 3,5-epimerase